MYDIFITPLLNKIVDKRPVLKVKDCNYSWDTFDTTKNDLYKIIHHLNKIFHLSYY